MSREAGPVVVPQASAAVWALADQTPHDARAREAAAALTASAIDPALAIPVQRAPEEPAEPEDVLDAYDPNALPPAVPEERIDPATERLSPTEAALWLSRWRDLQRAHNKKHGGGLMAACFQDVHGYYIERKWATRLADRGDALRVEMAQKPSPEMELAKTYEDLEFYRQAARFLTEEAMQEKKLMAIAEGIKSGITVSNERAQIHGQHAARKSAVKVEATIEHRYEDDTAVTEVRDLLAELVAEQRAQADPVKAVTGDITLTLGPDGVHG